MITNVHVPDYDTVKVDVPEICIHCNKPVGLIIVSISKVIEFEHHDSFAITVVCPSCHSFSTFELQTPDHWSSNDFTLIDYSYTKNVDVILPNNIEKISKEFTSLYQQAATAEAYGLFSICGVGYRKAAEFLIKDYAISKFPENEESIKSSLLGQVISEKLTDFPKIQTLAKATTWIGNDETHYLKKHTDKDLSDLKKFLFATATFITADYDADQALKFINK